MYDGIRINFSNYLPIAKYARILVLIYGRNRYT